MWIIIQTTNIRWTLQLKWHHQIKPISNEIQFSIISYANLMTFQYIFLSCLLIFILRSFFSSSELWIRALFSHPFDWNHSKFLKWKERTKIRLPSAVSTFETFHLNRHANVWTLPEFTHSLYTYIYLMFNMFNVFIRFCFKAQLYSSQTSKKCGLYSLVLAWKVCCLLWHQNSMDSTFETIKCFAFHRASIHTTYYVNEKS